MGSCQTGTPVFWRFRGFRPPVFRIFSSIRRYSLFGIRHLNLSTGLSEITGNFEVAWPIREYIAHCCSSATWRGMGSGIISKNLRAQENAVRRMDIKSQELYSKDDGAAACLCWNGLYPLCTKDIRKTGAVPALLSHTSSVPRPFTFTSQTDAPWFHTPARRPRGPPLLTRANSCAHENPNT